jgi:O-antigen/teichoic acid export membrane protein
LLKKNILANYFGQFYSIIIGIVMVPFYLKYLGEEAYGLVGFFALMQSWMMLLDMGISPVLSREVAKVRSSINEDAKIVFKKLLHSLEFLFVIIAFSIATLIFIYSNDISVKWLIVETIDVKTVSYCILLMGIMIALRFIITLYNSGITGAEAQVWQNIANMVIQTLKFVGVLFILEFISTDIKYFFEYQLVISILEFIIFSNKFYSIMNIGNFKFYFSYSVIKPHIPFALGIAYTAGIWVFLTQFDKLLLSGILPLKEYGYFAIISLVANAIIQISSPISKSR